MTTKADRCYEAAKRTLVEYFQKSSVNGFRLLYFLRSHKYQRVIWFLLIVVTLFCAMYFIDDINTTWRKNTIVVGMEVEGMDAADVPFPAIAICSTNQLSRQAVREYAQKLARLSERNASYWFEQLRFLWAYYRPTADIDLEVAKQFQHDLDRISIDSGYNLHFLLTALAPSCETQLIKCRISNVVTPCDQIFQLTLTPVGHCCLFNHNTNDNNKNVQKRRKALDSSIRLSVLLNTSAQDFFIENAILYQVHIISTHNFPDAGIGSKQEFAVSPGETVSVMLNALVQISTPTVRSYDPDQRHCYFLDEQHEKYGLGYSQAACLSLCRFQSVQKLCACLPHHALPDVFTSLDRSLPFCTFTHFDCVREHFRSLQTFQPGHPQGLQYTYDDIDYIECVKCMPLCSYFKYAYTKRSDRLHQVQHLNDIRKFLSNRKVKANERELAMLELYFSEMPARLYHKDVLFKWYEILSMLGGILSIWVGCSLISCIEIAYFGFYRFWRNLRHTDT